MISSYRFIRPMAVALVISFVPALTVVRAEEGASGRQRPGPPTGWLGPGAADGPAFSLCAAQATGAEVCPVPRPRPWLVPIEIVGLNMGIWAWDRYVARAPWAYINWSTVRNNFRQFFAFDSDAFFTNFFLHPYHGSLYYEAARSLGMNYWLSSFSAFGGSLMWELFLENERPSTNDLIMTTTGGIFWGEFLFRMSSLVLDDGASGGGRFLREALGFLVCPLRGLNRLIFGDAWRVDPMSRQIHQPLKGRAELTGDLVAENDSFSGTRLSPGVALEFTYGDDRRYAPACNPFDLILLRTSVRSGAGLTCFLVDGRGLITGRGRSYASGRSSLFGLFQNFDYIKNEEIELGGTSLTAGLISYFPLGPRWLLRTSVQAGAMVFGASNNTHTEIASRDYNYGLGPVAKADAELAHSRFGSLALALRYYVIYTIESGAFDPAETHDHLAVIEASYGIPVFGSVGLRVHYGLDLRHIRFEGFPAINQSLSRLGLAATFSF